MATAAKKTASRATADVPKASAVKKTPAKAAEAAPQEVQATAQVKAPDKAKAKAAKPQVAVMSEAALLKMPERDYMNEAQLAFFKNRLLAMKEEILANARETGEHLKENEVFADPNDRATVEEENMLEQRVRDRERKLLKKIDQALARIDSGDYGYCLETGEPIGIPRLLARPTAELSIEAQEKHERMERMFAD